MKEAQRRKLAQRAYWSFDCYFGMNSGDYSIFTGDGIDDLDSFIAKLESHMPFAKDVRLLADAGDFFSCYVPFDLEDVRDIRRLYVSWYGETNKPDVTIKTASVAIPIPL